MKKVLLGLLAVIGISTLAACGGGSGGGGGVACSYSTPITEPSINLTGTWSLPLSVSSNCPIIIYSETCEITFSQADGSNDVTGSGTCTASTSQGTVGGTISVSGQIDENNQLYMGGTLSVDLRPTQDYYETDTLDCTQGQMYSTSSDDFSITWTANYVSGGVPDSCTGISTGSFTKI